MTTTYDEIVERILAGGQASADDVLTVLRTPDEEVMDLVAAVSRLRRAHFGMTVKVNYLVNLKSGLCPEDCGYCSQALGSTSEILRYTWLGKDEALAQAEAGLRGGATRVCMVASGRGPTDRDIDRVADMVGAIKDENPDVEVCACLGLLKDGQAERLRAAGVDAYNHNINTAESHHDTIVSTHTYEDRVRTVAKAQGAGLSACSGLIAGLGESDEQLVEALTALRDMGSDSIPVARSRSACPSLSRPRQAQTSTSGFSSLIAPTMSATRSMSRSVGPRPLATMHTRVAPPRSPASAWASASSFPSQV